MKSETLSPVASRRVRTESLREKAWVTRQGSGWAAQAPRFYVWDEDREVAAEWSRALLGQGATRETRSR